MRRTHKRDDQSRRKKSEEFAAPQKNARPLGPLLILAPIVVIGIIIVFFLLEYATGGSKTPVADESRAVKVGPSESTPIDSLEPLQQSSPDEDVQGAVNLPGAIDDVPTPDEQGEPDAQPEDQELSDVERAQDPEDVPANENTEIDSTNPVPQ